MSPSILLLSLCMVEPGTQPASAPAQPVHESSEEEPSTPMGRASVEVDTSHVGSEGPVIHRRILERGDVTLRAHGILPAQEPDDPRIRVRVSELQGEDPGYAAEITTREYRDSIECPLCTETELVGRIEERLAVLAKELPRLYPEPEREPEPQPITPVEDADTRLGPKGKAGIALLVVGVAGVGTGVGLVLRQDTPKKETPLEATSTHLPGYITIGVGAAVTIVGGVLLGLDRREAKRRRVALTPWLGPRRAGAFVSGKF